MMLRRTHGIHGIKGLMGFMGLLPPAALRRMAVGAVSHLRKGKPEHRLTHLTRNASSYWSRWVSANVPPWPTYPSP
jgi:hypothetical protein